jgi:hypothetical protein
MGHLVNAYSFRLGISKLWRSKWSIISLPKNYFFLLNSDRNIDILLERFFSNKFFIKNGFIFSHLQKIKNYKFNYFIIYFWNGKFMENFKEDLHKFLFYLNKKIYLNKINLSLLFFYNFFIKKFFFKFFSHFIISKIWFFLFYKHLCKYFAFFILFKLLKFSKNFILIFFFFVFLNKFIFIFFIKILYFIFTKRLILFCFFFKLKNYFAKIYTNVFLMDIFSNYLKTGFFVNSLQGVLLKKIIDFFFNKLFKKSFKFSQSFIILRPIEHININSQIIAKYLSIRMQQRYRLLQALRPVFKDLKKNPLIDGYKIMCSGRFTKKEIATFQWHRSGRVSTSTLYSFLDYTLKTCVLKYSKCSFKVWLNTRPDKINFFNLFRFYYNDLYYFSNYKKKTLKIFILSKNFHKNFFWFNKNFFVFKNYIKIFFKNFLINKKNKNKIFLYYIFLRHLILFFTKYKKIKDNKF